MGSWRPRSVSLGIPSGPSHWTLFGHPHSTAPLQGIQLSHRRESHGLVISSPQVHPLVMGWPAHFPPPSHTSNQAVHPPSPQFSSLIMQGLQEPQPLHTSQGAQVRPGPGTKQVSQGSPEIKKPVSISQTVVIQACISLHIFVGLIE